MTSNGAMSVGATELTTTIKGNAISELCLQRAGMLNFDIYDTPRASLPAEYCGQGAVCCSYMNALAVCLPTVCLENATCPVLE